MLGECHYAVETSDLLGREPRRVVVAGHEIVLFRDAGGQAHALDARCPHRFADLSGGETRGDCVACPYHGWEFDGGGACTRIPANPPDQRVPKRARVRSWPTVERYGLVWIYLGVREDRPPLPPFPEFGQPGWRAISGEFTWKAHYARVVENGLDFAHGPFVHATSFGRKDRPEVGPYEVEEIEGGGRAELDLPASRPRGLWGLFQRGERPPVHVTLEFWMPSVNRIDLRLGNGWRIVIFDCNVPVDESHTRTVWVSLRNFFPGPWADGNARQRVLEVFREDRPIVEAQAAGPPPPAAGQVSVRSDRLPLHYREMREAWLASGRVPPGRSPGK